MIQNNLNFLPNAKSAKSHSLTNSSIILDSLKEKGITHECNHLIPAETGIILKPWWLWNGLIRVPFFWEDDYSCVTTNPCSIDQMIKREGLKIFDFHPIHIFLNTESLNRYEKTREHHSNADILINYRFSGYGTRSKFIELLEMSNNQ